MEKSTKDFALEPIFEKMVPQQMIMAQAPWQQDEVLFKLLLMRIILVIKNYTTKKRRDSGWGGATPFL